MSCAFVPLFTRLRACPREEICYGTGYFRSTYGIHQFQGVLYFCIYPSKSPPRRMHTYNYPAAYSGILEAFERNSVNTPSEGIISLTPSQSSSLAPEIGLDRKIPRVLGEHVPVEIWNVVMTPLDGELPTLHRARIPSISSSLSFGAWEYRQAIWLFLRCLYSITLVQKPVYQQRQGDRHWSPINYAIN